MAQMDGPGPPCSGFLELSSKGSGLSASARRVVYAEILESKLVVFVDDSKAEMVATFELGPRGSSLALPPSNRQKSFALGSGSGDICEFACSNNAQKLAWLKAIGAIKTGTVNTLMAGAIDTSNSNSNSSNNNNNNNNINNNYSGSSITNNNSTSNNINGQTKVVEPIRDQMKSSIFGDSSSNINSTNHSGFDGDNNDVSNASNNHSSNYNFIPMQNPNPSISLHGSNMSGIQNIGREGVGSEQRLWLDDLVDDKLVSGRVRFQGDNGRTKNNSDSNSNTLKINDLKRADSDYNYEVKSTPAFLFPKHRPLQAVQRLDVDANPAPAKWILRRMQADQNQAKKAESLEMPPEANPNSAPVVMKSQKFAPNMQPSAVVQKQNLSGRVAHPQKWDLVTKRRDKAPPTGWRVTSPKGKRSLNSGSSVELSNDDRAAAAPLELGRSFERFSDPGINQSQQEMARNAAATCRSPYMRRKAATPSRFDQADYAEGIGLDHIMLKMQHDAMQAAAAALEEDDNIKMKQRRVTTRGRAFAEYESMDDNYNNFGGNMTMNVVGDNMHKRNDMVDLNNLSMNGGGYDSAYQFSTPVASYVLPSQAAQRQQIQRNADNEGDIGEFSNSFFGQQQGMPDGHVLSYANVGGNSRSNERGSRFVDAGQIGGYANDTSINRSNNNGNNIISNLNARINSSFNSAVNYSETVDIAPVSNNNRSSSNLVSSRIPILMVPRYMRERSASAPRIAATTTTTTLVSRVLHARVNSDGNDKGNQVAVNKFPLRSRSAPRSIPHSAQQSDSSNNVRSQNKSSSNSIYNYHGKLQRKPKPLSDKEKRDNSPPWGAGRGLRNSRNSSNSGSGVNGNTSKNGASTVATRAKVVSVNLSFANRFNGTNRLQTPKPDLVAHNAIRHNIKNVNSANPYVIPKAATTSTSTFNVDYANNNNEFSGYRYGPDDNQINNNNTNTNYDSDDSSLTTSDFGEDKFDKQGSKIVINKGVFGNSGNGGGNKSHLRQRQPLFAKSISRDFGNQVVSTANTHPNFNSNMNNSNANLSGNYNHPSLNNNQFLSRIPMANSKRIVKGMDLDVIVSAELRRFQEFNGHMSRQIGLPEDGGRQESNIVSSPSNRGDPGINISNSAEWERLMNWLDSIGMSQYAPAFKSYRLIKMSELELLTNANLVNIGIFNESDRTTLLRHIATFSRRTNMISDADSRDNYSKENSNIDSNKAVLPPFNFDAGAIPRDRAVPGSAVSFSLSNHNVAYALSPREYVYQGMMSAPDSNASFSVSEPENVHLSLNQNLSLVEKEGMLDPKDDLGSLSDALDSEHSTLRRKAPRQSKAHLIASHSEACADPHNDKGRIAGKGIINFNSNNIKNNSNMYNYYNIYNNINNNSQVVEDRDTSADGSPEVKYEDVILENGSIYDTLMMYFDSGNYEQFEVLWNAFMFKLFPPKIIAQLEESHKIDAKFIDTLNAKIALEFYMYLHFAIYELKYNNVSNGPSFEEKTDVLLNGSEAAKAMHKYRLFLDTLNAYIYAKNSLDLTGCSTFDSIICNHTLWRSKEFVLCCAVALVPHPHEHPLLAPLFKDKWTEALKEKLSAFMHTVGMNNIDAALDINNNNNGSSTFGKSSIGKEFNSASCKVTAESIGEITVASNTFADDVDSGVIKDIPAEITSTIKANNHNVVTFNIQPLNPYKDSDRSANQRLENLNSDPNHSDDNAAARNNPLSLTRMNSPLVLRSRSRARSPGYSSHSSEVNSDALNLSSDMTSIIVTGDGSSNSGINANIVSGFRNNPGQDQAGGGGEAETIRGNDRSGDSIAPRGDTAVVDQSTAHNLNPTPAASKINSFLLKHITVPKISLPIFKKSTRTDQQTSTSANPAL